MESICVGVLTASANAQRAPLGVLPRLLTELQATQSRLVSAGLDTDADVPLLNFEVLVSGNDKARGRENANPRTNEVAKAAQRHACLALTGRHPHAVSETLPGQLDLGLCPP